MQISKYIPRPLILIFAILVLGLAATVLVTAPLPPHAPAPSLIGGPFSLRDMDGKTVTEENLKGLYSLIYFGYSNEKDATPTELRVIAASLDLLGPNAERFKAYFVTLDPGRDEPEVLKAYLKGISPRLIGLTGTPDQIVAMAKAYHVFFERRAEPKEQGGYAMDYSPLIYVMGPDEKFIKPFQYTTDAKTLAEGLKMVLE